MRKNDWYFRSKKRKEKKKCNTIFHHQQQPESNPFQPVNINKRIAPLNFLTNLNSHVMKLRKFSTVKHSTTQNKYF